jgi:hypothetical protein
MRKSFQWFVTLGAWSTTRPTKSISKNPIQLWVEMAEFSNDPFGTNHNRLTPPYSVSHLATTVGAKLSVHSGALESFLAYGATASSGFLSRRHAMIS